MRKRFFDKHADVSKPRASELDRRNRESGLNQAVRSYSLDPEDQTLTAPAAWVSFDGAPSVEAFVDGVRYAVPLSAISPATGGTGISFVAASTGSGATNPSANKPAGTLAGHKMIAFLSNNGSGTSVTPPVGWSLIRRTDYTTNLSLLSYEKNVTSSEPSGYTWTQSDLGALVILTYAGVDSVNVSTGATDSTGTTATAPTATTTVDNALVIRAFAVETGTVNAATLSPTSGTERAEASYASGAVGAHTVEASDVFQAVAGVTGTATATASEAVFFAAQTIALAPA